MRDATAFARTLDAALPSHSNGAVNDAPLPSEGQRGEGVAPYETTPNSAVTPADILLQRGLSPRQLEIVELIARGCSNKEIAIRVGSTEATVKVHLKHILAKANLNNRTQLAVWWVTKGERCFEVPEFARGASLLDGIDLLERLIGADVGDEVIYRALNSPAPAKLVPVLLHMLRKRTHANPS